MGVASSTVSCPRVSCVARSTSSSCISTDSSSSIAPLLQKELAEVWAASNLQQAPASAHSASSLQDPSQQLEELTQQRKSNENRKLSTDRKLSADLDSNRGSQDKGAGLRSSSLAVHKHQDVQQPSGCAAGSPPCLRWLPYKVCVALQQQQQQCPERGTSWPQAGWQHTVPCLLRPGIASSRGWLRCLRLLPLPAKVITTHPDKRSTCNLRPDVCVLQAVAATLRRYPSIAIISLLLFMVLTTGAVIGVIYIAANETHQRRLSAEGEPRTHSCVNC